MLMFEKTALTNYLALYDTEKVIVESVFYVDEYNDKSYINIHYGNEACWYSLKYCAFESEENVISLRNEIVNILSDYYYDDNLKVVNHYIN